MQETLANIDILQLVFLTVRDITISLLHCIHTHRRKERSGWMNMFMYQSNLPRRFVILHIQVDMLNATLHIFWLCRDCKESN